LRSDEEETLPMLRRRRHRKKASELARLLVALDSIASQHRGWRPRRHTRLSLGSGR
jgi:hypothetical protein